MKQEIKDLAIQAGFCFFTAEEDPLEPLDWSCEYSAEFEKFADLLEKDATKQATNKALLKVLTLLEKMHEASSHHNFYLVAATRIRDELSLYD